MSRFEIVEAAITVSYYLYIIAAMNVSAMIMAREDTYGGFSGAYAPSRHSLSVSYLGD